MTFDWIFFVSAALFLIASVFSVRRNMHMFQLNSYRADRHFPWLARHFGSLLPSMLLLIGGVLCLLFPVVMPYVCFGLYLIQIIANLPKKNAKKPLKYTGRVKRMLGTCLFLSAVIIVLALVLLPADAFYAVLAILCALMPLLVPCSNLVNAPMEAMFRSYYTNDAKRMLRECPDLTVIGVTGSYGKTSTKFALGTLLRTRYDTLVTPENYNTPLGVVRTVRSMLRATHRMFVCEMGADHVGDIRELCRLAHPKYGVITTIGEQHLETFGSLDAIIRTKFEIYAELPPDGILFVNGDCSAIMDHLPSGGARICTYGLGEHCEYRGKVERLTHNGTEFSVRMPDGSEPHFTTPLLGEHNVQNLTGAIAVASELGISATELVSAVKKVTAVSHRMQLTSQGNVTLIDDAYNSNPAGCRAALRTLSMFEETKILVTPGMVELGTMQESLNREFGREAADVCDHVILVGRRQTEPILEGLKEAGYPDEKIYVSDSTGDAIRYAYALPAQGRRVILLENDLPDNY